MKIRGIILAAGLSSRMGDNKLSRILNGIPIIETVIKNAQNSKLDELVLIYGKYSFNTNVKKIYNSNYEDGMSTSIIEGLKGFCGDGIMILLGDMPFVKSKIINKLYDTFESTEKNIAVPRFNNRRGNPVLIGEKYFNELLNNKGDKGAREIIQKNQSDIEWVEVDTDGIFIDIDDEASYQKALVK